MSDDMGEIDYRLPAMSKFKWISLVFTLLVVGFLLYFPSAEKMEKILSSTLEKIPGCPIKVGQMQFEWLLPKMVLTDVQIPAGCIGTQPVVLKDIKLNMRGFNFSPLGPHFKTDINLKGNLISAYITLGLSQILIKLDDNKLKLDNLYGILPANLNLQGNVNLNVLMALSHAGDIQDLQLLLKSSDVVLPAQMIVLIKMPPTAIGNLYLKAHMDEGKKIMLDDFILGNDDADIRMKFNGNIVMTSGGFSNSRLDLKGELALSQPFMEKFAILKMVLAKFTQKDNFYQIKISGTPSNMSTSTY